MTYSLRFHALALKEWAKLDSHTKGLFKKKLAERLENPHVPSARLHSMEHCYKIKLRSVGYRLVYQVDDGVVTVTVISVGKRDRLEVYLKAASRM
ncbi:MAG: type II toxin-antitoxin system RelE/ParE family toxin [Pseudomonadota bacterium]